MTSHFQKFSETFGFKVSLTTNIVTSVRSSIKRSYRGKIGKKRPIERFYTGGGRDDINDI